MNSHASPLGESQESAPGASMPRLKTKTIIPAPRKYNRRSEEQLIADLQARIEGIKTRAATKVAKKNPAVRLTNQAVRSIDEALEVAENAAHRESLTEARMALVAYLQLDGLKIPQRRGRKPGKATGVQDSVAVV
jgi:hypothetical protein